MKEDVAKQMAAEGEGEGEEEAAEDDEGGGGGTGDADDFGGKQRHDFLKRKVETAVNECMEHFGIDHRYPTGDEKKKHTAAIAPPAADVAWSDKKTHVVLDRKGFVSIFVARLSELTQVEEADIERLYAAKLDAAYDEAEAARGEVTKYDAYLTGLATLRADTDFVESYVFSAIPANKQAWTHRFELKSPPAPTKLRRKEIDIEIEYNLSLTVVQELREVGRGGLWALGSGAHAREQLLYPPLPCSLPLPRSSRRGSRRWRGGRRRTPRCSSASPTS